MSWEKTAFLSNKMTVGQLGIQMKTCNWILYLILLTKVNPGGSKMKILLAKL